MKKRDKPFKAQRGPSALRQLFTALLGSAGMASAQQVAGPASVPAPRAPAGVAATATAAGPAASTSAALASLPRKQTVNYKHVAQGDLILQIVRPDPAKFPGPRPAIVFFHGGGWRTGSPTTFKRFSEALAEHGVVGISAQYRLMEPNERLPHDAVRDARSALRYVRAHAESLGVDCERIGAGGASSGGHLALMTALKPPYDDPSDDLTVSPKPALLILMNPPLDMDDFPSPVPVAQRRDLSPLHLLEPGLPPTLIFQGTADKIVPAKQAPVFRDRAAALGNKDVTVVMFEGRKHGFFHAGKGDGSDFTATLNSSVEMLTRLAWIGR
jgi:acetyl esterase